MDSKKATALCKSLKSAAALLVATTMLLSGCASSVDLEGAKPLGAAAMEHKLNRAPATDQEAKDAAECYQMAYAQTPPNATSKTLWVVGFVLLPVGLIAPVIYESRQGAKRESATAECLRSRGYVPTPND